MEVREGDSRGGRDDEEEYEDEGEDTPEVIDVAAPEGVVKVLQLNEDGREGKEAGNRELKGREGRERIEKRERGGKVKRGE